MATPSNKPRDIKNLKARLGRTITPGQTGQPGIPGAPGAVPGASVPPPIVGGGFPGVPGQPGQPGQPGAPAPQGAAPSPYGRPAGAQPSRSPLGGPAAPGNPLGAPPSAGRPSVPGGAARVDPFAASAAPTVGSQKRVTLVIDDSAVKEDEIGRKSAGKAIAVAATGAIVGLAIGFGIGNTMDKRSQYSMAVRDGKDIYAKIQEVSKSVDTAKDLVKKAVESASGAQPKVDIASIEQLVQLKRPFTANEFHRRLYRAFGDNVVDELFDYYNNTNLLWDGFTALGAKTAGDKKRDALAKSAAAADGLVSTDYGVVLAKNGNAFAGGLVFMTVQPPPPAAAEEEGKKKGKGKKGKDAAPSIMAKVASAQGGQEVERTLFTGQAEAR